MATATYTFLDNNNNPTSAALDTFVHLSIDDGMTNLFADDYADIRMILGATYVDGGGKTVGVFERFLLGDPAMVHPLLFPYVCPDWNSSSGSTQILNKPSIGTVISEPSPGNSFTSGTAFQPRSGGPCMLNVQATLSGIVGITGTVIVAMSSTQNGTYATVSTDRLLISVLNVTADQTTTLIPVPDGYWVKVTLSGGVTGTYTRWDL
jgi:hypothetical protein